MDKYVNEIIGIIINHTGLDPEDVADSSYFEDDLNVGPLELLDILATIEETYSIVFDEDEKKSIESVMDLVELVIEKVE